MQKGLNPMRKLGGDIDLVFRREIVRRPPAFCWESCGKPSDWNDMRKVMFRGTKTLGRHFPPPEKVPEMR